MDLYVPLSLFIILITFLSKNNHSSKQIFLLSMIILCVFACLRYNFGPDYESYWVIYDTITRFGIGSRAEGEPVFYYYLQSFPSYTLFIITNSLLWFTAFYLFYKQYVDEKYFWLLLLFILFTESCVIDSMVAMRSGMASFLFLAAYVALLKKKRIFFLIIVGVTVFIHTSTIALLPLVILGTNKRSLFFNWFFVLAVCAFAVITTFYEHNMIMSMLALQLTDSVEDFSKYAHYLEDMSSTSSLIRHFILKILCVIPYLFIVTGAKKEKEESYILIYKLAMIVPILSLLLGQGMMARYFMLFNCFYIVALIRSIRYTTRLYAVVSIAAVIIANVFMFYNSMAQDYNVSIWHYQTIFSAPKIP